MNKFSYKHDIVESCLEVYKNNKSENLETSLGILSDMENAKVFRIPNIESLPSLSNYKDFHEFMKLPFDDIFIEMMVFKDKSNIKESEAGMFISNTLEGGVVCHYYLKDNNNNWFVATAFAIYLDEDNFHVEKVSVQDSGKAVDRLSWAVIQFLVAVNTPNIKQIEVKSPKLINSKRKKKGKPLIAGYHFLDLPNPATSGESIGTGGNKRSHWRRGHIRRLKDRTTWVRACFVGNGEFVGKTYRVGYKK